MENTCYREYSEPLERFVSAVFENESGFTHHLEIAGHHVRLQSSSRLLLDKLVPSLDHLTTPSPDITPAIESEFIISLVDMSTVEGAKIPDIPWGLLLQCGHRGLRVEHIYLQFVHLQSTDVRILSMYDRVKNRACYIVSDAKRLPWYISGAPMHEIVYWWVRANGMHVLHCGVFGNHTQGVALLGAKGAGKSTLVLSGLENGFQYIAEDYCIVTKDPIPVAYSLYNSAKFTQFTFNRFPHLARYRQNSEAANEKHLVFYRDIYPDKMLRKVSLSALVSLDLNSDADTTLHSIEPNKAYIDMIASTSLQNPIFELSSTQFFQELKSKVPAYSLTFGRDTDSALKLLASLVE